MKASMVGAVFMHLNHEQKWIIGRSADPRRFIILMTVPIFTTMDTPGTHEPALPSANARRRGSLRCRFERFICSSLRCR